MTPLPLTANNPYPLGDVAFGEFLLECCLAKAEERRNDTQGVHKAVMQERMLAAIASDKRSSGETVLGYNSDPGMLRSATGIRHIGNGYVMYNDPTLYTEWDQ
jgi:hypothetical protein